ncbi:AraC family transcriptional regulator [Pseudemcibacter aquimaris]|uniref:AraC family transcriptional regulator n=1 Tax=Pseudemcibacter aquimaris TaxID=2857064 RepID=UPI002012C4CF|nr:AraC family transcriptional regulator [Pseudemcibacter aquimaris]MCC3859664.1 AraC family transcriptional regulator [Pseudemcibacter aquimaris]WDU60059.1 AraC family transcriptional regulator [Pseudemcibacter aquimaris]
MTCAIREYQDTIETHTHDDFHQVVIPFTGGLEIDIEGRQGIIAGREIGIVVQGERHSFRADDDNRFLVLDIENQADPEIERLWQIAVDKPFLKLSEASLSLTNYARFNSHVAKSDKLLRLWQSLFIQSLSSEIDNGIDHIPERLKKVLHYIEMNYATQISNKDLADVACLSSSQLHHVFQSTLGTSPQKYVTERKLSAAKQLMLKGMSLAHIADEVGFADQGSFSRAFKQHHGISPGAWRKQELALKSPEFG